MSRPESSYGARRGEAGVSDQPKNFAKSANRALDILEFIASLNRPAKAAEIANGLGLARSSVHQLLTTMVAGGYLICGEGVRYFPSPRSAQIGSWLSRCYPDLDGLRETVEELHDLTHETVTLSIQSDCVMRIAAMSGQNGREWLTRMGWQVPVFGTAIGGAALSDKAPRAISRLAERARRQHVLGRAVAVDQSYLEELRRFRMKGYSWGLTRPENFVADDAKPQVVWSIALKLPQSDTGTDVVIGVSGPVARVRSREREIVNIMHRTIRNRLGRAGNGGIARQAMHENRS
jgi:DNA-binding IclR family transcriptional regulator